MYKQRYIPNSNCLLQSISPK